MATATVVKKVDTRTPEQIAQDKANQESTNEQKTPEQLAAEALLKDQMVEVSGTAYAKLETIVRYLNRNKIQARGERWFEKNSDILFQDAMEKLIEAREKAIVDQLAKQEQAEKDEAFRGLVARGITITEAYAKVYSN